MRIDSFNAEYRFLSNFWYVNIEFEGRVYRSVEHAYVAAKTLDLEVREIIQKIEKVSDVKRYGRSIELRKDWEEVKLDYMEEFIRQKFENPELRKKLIDTAGYELIEGNTWGDTFWGVCKGVGKNNLGKILMKIRDEIIHGNLLNHFE